jgi:hypothetical protein
VLAENDDEVYAQRRDSLLSYTLPKEGIYYLKLRAWKHPVIGGDTYFYTIRLYEDHISPTVQITWPISESFLPDAIMTLTASVSEPNNMINRVEFFWYSNDWLSAPGKNFGTDWNGNDGWEYAIQSGGATKEMMRHYSSRYMTWQETGPGSRPGI